jgi:hypothetical protein
MKKMEGERQRRDGSGDTLEKHVRETHRWRDGGKGTGKTGEKRQGERQGKRKRGKEPQGKGPL